jgi:hypothetical protein
MDHDREHVRRRVARLRALAAQLEQLPQSPARDRLLREAHQRTVMVDTGVPSALFENMSLGRFAGGR